MTAPIIFAAPWDAKYLPTRAHEHDAGYDLRARVDFGSFEILDPGDRLVVPTGIHVALAPGYVGLVCPRSGLAAKKGVTVLNAPGVIDAGYRDEVGVILYNSSDSVAYIEDGDRIAQLVVQQVVTDHEVTFLDDLPAPGDERLGGFGSSGR